MEYNHLDFYKYYAANSKKKFKNKRIWKRGYYKILADYYYAVSKVIIYDAFPLYLSHRMGTILIYKYKSDNTYTNPDGSLKKNRLPIDWPETKRIWKEDYGDISKEELKAIKDKPLVYLFNEHSDGYQYKWHWDKRSCVAKNQSMYYFTAVRANKRKLASAIKNIKYLDFPELKIKTK